MKVLLILKNTSLILACALLSSCASKTPLNQSNQSVIAQSVAIVGVVVAPDVQSGVSRGGMVRDLTESIHAAGGYRTLRSSDVEISLNKTNPEAYDALITRFAEEGVLGLADLNALSGAGLPVQMALIARVERNQTRKEKFRVETLRNHAGTRLNDRERRVLITEREVQVRATLIDVATGQVAWSRSYRSVPQTELAYLRYYGSSFSGTLAASLVNTMTTGLNEPDWPSPASYQQTLQTLMREIVRNLPK